jgi:hypothetical protein
MMDYESKKDLSVRQLVTFESTERFLMKLNKKLTPLEITWS